MGDAPPEPTPPSAPPPPAVVPRFSALLLASLALSGASVLVPSVFGPFGPLLAGVLAFVGYRAVRKSKGILRGPVLAAVAMTVALGLFAFMGWNMVRSFATAEAWRQIRAHIADVEATLRNGTAEGAWELLDSRARKGMDRTAFVKDLRDAMTRLGPLVSLGESRQAGGGWDETVHFEEAEGADLHLPMDIDALFRGGPGRVHVVIFLHRRDRAVSSEITELRVEAAGK